MQAGAARLFADAATPTAIEGGKAWLFTVFRVLSGGGFATLTSNVTPLLHRLFGLRDLHVAVAVTSWFEPLAGGMKEVNRNRFLSNMLLMIAIFFCWSEL